VAYAVHACLSGIGCRAPRESGDSWTVMALPYKASLRTDVLTSGISLIKESPSCVRIAYPEHNVGAAALNLRVSHTRTNHPSFKVSRRGRCPPVCYDASRASC